MKPLYTLALFSLLASSASAQYCTSGGPTSLVDSNVESVQLTGQSGTIQHTGCPSVLGVQDLTALSTTLVAGNTYTIYVQFGTCNGNYLGSGEVWIDYDQSDSFDPQESLGTWTGTPPVPQSTFTFTVPANAHNGTTRMRVMQREGNIPPPLDPCDSYDWGSVMDFSIVITGGLDCSAYLGDSRAEAIVVGSLPYTHSNDNSICYTNKNLVYPSPDVFYRVVPSPFSYAIRATLCGSSFDTFLSVIDNAGNVISYNDDATLCAPQSELMFLTAGIDTAYVIVEGWGMAQGLYTLTLTEDFVGIAENTTPQFNIFPNPTESYFVVGGAFNTNISIMDVAGKIVLTHTAYQGEKIYTETLAPGFYFVSIDNGENVFTQKIMVIK
ncbi:MAG: T9SS type A sorting domain-containing protein [Bacteroidia bacterium]